MLNENILEKIFQKPFPVTTVSDIHWKAQDSTKNSILFYKILDDEKSQELFTQRIATATFSWLVINKDHSSRPLNSLVVDEKEWPRVQKEILDHIYPLPPQLKLIAVTGTNGKTTTADLILQLGEMSHKKGLSIGTLGVRENHKTILDFGMTSPCFIDLRKFLHTYGGDKDFCVIEASSHALSQDRLYGLEFNMAGWLSFSQDHLDYHQTMEEYFSAKMLLANYLKPTGKIILPSEQQNLFNKISKATDKIEKASEIERKLPLFFSTGFNRNNLEVAVSIVEKVFSSEISVNFEQIIPPDGRFYIKPYKSNFIVVDFAHTPDALDNICRGIRSAFPSHQLKVLFGCGGDRDRSKRPMMGKIAGAWASKVYVTSDNPRNENAEQIIEDILKGIEHNNVHSIINRPEAVRTAFEELAENEILLLAGKGHEDYILIKGIKHPYSDIVEVENFVARKSK
jgi:UDP-N-acetylmuramoyl-L-alanyl-D-glutamate--2,6-diaminopimelate ligase